MNNSHNNDETIHDPALSSLYQQSKREEPPMALGSAILHQARKAVTKKPKWHFNWLIPTASTAMILLAVTVSWQNRDAVLVHEKDVVTSMADSEQMQLEHVQRKQKQEQEKLQLFQRPAKLSEEKAASAPVEVLKRKRMATAPAPSTATIDESEISLDVAEPVPQAPARSNKAQTGIASYAAKPTAARSLAKEPVKLATDSFNKEQTTPEAWIKDIETLLEQGKEKQAQEEFKAFRKRFPDYKVPEKLLKKLTELGID